MMDGIDRVSPHILISEYACPCCRKLPPGFRIYNPEDCFTALFNKYESIRRAYGKAIPISSGYRCPSHNEAVGGGKMSVHQFGLALDLNVPDICDVNDLYEIILRLHPELRVGKYTDGGTFVHVDVGYMICPIGSEAWVEGKRWYG